MDDAIIVVVFLFLVALVLALVVGPVLAIAAFVRSRRVAEFGERLHELERRLKTLERHEAPPVAKDLAADEREPPRIQSPVRRRPRIPKPPPLPTLFKDSARIEAFVGRRVLAWIAAALLVLAASFFLNYAVRSKLIGPAGQIMVVAAFGAALCIAGYVRHVRGGRIVTQLLTGIGVVVLFLAVYASFSIYRLLTPTAAGIYLAILMGEAALLAVVYRSQAIAFLAVVGGLLTPLLIRQEGDPYVTYFIYLLVLNATVQMVFVPLSWVGLRALSMLGTHALFWLWFLDHYHPDKLSSVVVTQLLLWTTYVGRGWLAALRRPSKVEDWALQILAPWFLFLALRRVLAEFHPAWMGSFAMLMALIYTLFTFFSRRRPFVADPNRSLVFLVSALAFLGLSFPLQAKAYWATVGWVAEGAALWWLGLRIRAWPLRAAGAAFLAVSIIGAVYVMNVYAPEKPYWPIANRRTATIVVVAAGLLAAAWTARLFRDRLEPLDKVVRYAAGLAGIALIWLVLSFETSDTAVAFDPDPESLIPQTALSFVWALYASLLLALGFRLRHAATRWTALGLFSVTILKLLLYDLSELPGVYRVLTFFVGAVVLAGAAAVYRWVQLAHLNARREVSND